MKRPDGVTVRLQTDDLLILYWMMLGAPLKRIERATRLDAAALEDRISTIRELVGDSWEDICHGRVKMFPGNPPKSDIPWTGRHCASLLQRALKLRSAEEPFLYAAGDGSYSLGEVIGKVTQIRARMRIAGLGQGAMIAVDAAPRLETYLVTLAALAHGLVIVRLGETMGPDTIRQMAQTAPAKLTFTSRRSILEGVDGTGELVDLAVEQGGPGFRDFDHWLDEAPEPELVDKTPALVEPTDAALIGFTSGSTGLPKAVAIPHEALWRHGEASQNSLGFGAEDIFCSATDLTSNTSTCVVLMLPFLSGGRLVLPSAQARRQPVAYAIDCATYGVTCMMVVPSSLRTLVKMEQLSDPVRLEALKTIITSTGPLDPTTAERAHSMYESRIADVMGAREACTLLQTSGDNPDLIGSGGGLPLESLVMLLGPDGTPAKLGEVGELHIHSDCLMNGYLPSADDVDAANPSDGVLVEQAPVWFSSGDLAVLRPDGRVEVVGRSRDIIKAADGSIVYPIEVETVLNRANDVVESCVFVAYLANGIEIVGAAVIAPSASGDKSAISRRLRKAVRESLGPFKTPKHVLVLDELPRVGRGKPDRRALREMLESALDKPPREIRGLEP
ncbi:MAG: class I adenylate-forming enzyme family protein [Pseudomonadota bacterium]